MSNFRQRIRGREVSAVLLIINGLAFLFSAWLSQSLNINSLVLIILGGNFKPLVEQGEYWRLFTAMFLHGDILHLMFNMYALWALGGTLEMILSRPKFLGLYLLSGLGGSVLSTMMLDNTVSIGASGAIFGLVGALIGYVIGHRDMFRQGALRNLLFIVLINLMWGLQPGSGIDNFGHLGGVISGFLLSFIIKPGRR